MAAARPFRLRAAAVAWFAATGRQMAAMASGQGPSWPAAARRKVEHRSQAQSLPEAWACRQSLAAA